MRTGLPGHLVYNRVRNAIEVVESKMGNAIAADALRLAALRKALGCTAPDDEPDFPASLRDMHFQTDVLEVCHCDRTHSRNIDVYHCRQVLRPHV